MPSVLWKLFSTMGENSGTCGDNISTVGDTSSIVEVVQYCGGYSVHWGIPPVHAGDNISTVGDNISTVEGIQYSRDAFSTVVVNFNKFQKISKSFPELISLRNQINHIAGLKC